MALYLIVVEAHFIMNNVFEGMIWFFLPVSLVICNDIFAYICGITFGRTQLIKLSPKKTVEGFVGAWILTVVFGVGMTNVLMRYKYFICPVNVSGISGYILEKLKLTESGPWSKYLDRSPMYAKSGILTSRLQLPNLVSLRKIILHGPNAGPHSSFRDFRIAHRSIWWLLRFRT